MMEPITWAAVALALAKAVEIVGTELTKSILLKPAAETLYKQLLRGYDARKHADQVRGALEAAARAGARMRQRVHGKAGAYCVLRAAWNSAR